MRKFIEIVESEMVDEIKLFSQSPENWTLDISTNIRDEKSGLKFIGMLTDKIKIYQVNRNSDMQFFVLSLKNNAKMGYAKLLKFGKIDGWHISIALYPKFLGKGIGFLLYKYLLDHDYALISGHDQTKGSQVIWKKLMKTPGIKVKPYLMDNEPVVVDDPWKWDNVVLVARKSTLKEAWIDAYHGTNQDIEAFEFDKNIHGKSGSRESGLGFWFTDSPKAAGDFAAWASRGLGGNNIIPVKLKLDHPLVVKSYDDIKDIVDKFTEFKRPNYEIQGRNIRMMGDKINYDAARKWLKSKGYDGIILKNTLVDSPDGKPIDQYVVFDANQIRSRFAKFDPEKKDSPYISEDQMVDEIYRLEDDDDWEPDFSSIKFWKRQGKPKIFGVVNNIVLSEIWDEDERNIIISNKMGDVLGYIILTRCPELDGWYSSIALKEGYRRTGIGFILYKYLLQSGLTLVSGVQQSIGGEMLWKKMMRQPDIVVTACDGNFEPIELDSDHWSNDDLLIAKAGSSKNINEDDKIVEIPVTTGPYNRCTAVSTNAILAFFNKPLLKSGHVPINARESFDILERNNLRILPDITFEQKHMTVRTFVQTHPKGAWYIGTYHHAMAVINGRLVDAEGKGLDGRLVTLCVQVVK